MRDDQRRQFSAGYLKNVIDGIGDFLFSFRSSGQGATIDHYVVLVSSIAKSEQETITQPFAVHSDANLPVIRTAGPRPATVSGHAASGG
jgi:hypothetical protein